MIFISLIAFLGNYADTDGENSFNGILCHLKPKVSVSCRGDKWKGSRGNESDLICGITPYPDYFPVDEKPGVYIDFQLNGFLVHVDKFKIKGRGLDNEHNMVDWSIEGIKSDGTLDPLIHSTNELMANETKILDNPEHEKRILYSGFRIINNDLDTHHKYWENVTCSHIIITAFDVYGSLYMNIQTKSHFFHAKYMFFTIFIIKNK